MSKICKAIETYEKHPTYVRISVNGYGIIYFKNDTPCMQGKQIAEWRAHELLETPLSCNRITLVNKLPDYAQLNKWYRNGKEIQ